MLPAVSINDILDRRLACSGGVVQDDHPDLQPRIVSIIFANEGSPIWKDLKTNRALLDERSGERWDLFFAGMADYLPPEERGLPLPSTADGISSKTFQPTAFSDIEAWVSDNHRAAVGSGRWHYSGGTDLVSFICVGNTPRWESLTDLTLFDTSSGGDPKSPRTLNQITEEMRSWSEREPHPSLAPGEDVEPEALKNRLRQSLIETAAKLKIYATKTAGGELDQLAQGAIRNAVQKLIGIILGG